VGEVGAREFGAQEAERDREGDVAETGRLLIGTG
jgi:hypothetical protein